MTKMSQEIEILVEREKRRWYALKVAEFERAHQGIRIMPMQRDIKLGRIEQIVEERIERERRKY